MVNRPADAAEPDDASHVEALEQAGAVAYRGNAHVVERGVVEVRHDGAAHRVRGPRGRGRRRLDVARCRPSPVSMPCRSGRTARRRWRASCRGASSCSAAAHGLRARPGLRPVRRAGDDRPVGRPAGAHGPSAQLRGDRRDAPRGRRRGPAGLPRHRCARRRGHRTAPTSSTCPMARSRRATRCCSRWGGTSRSTTSGSRLRRRHDRPDALPARRPAADRRRAVGDRRPGRAGAAHPPGATTRARSPSGWRSATTSARTTARCHARRTRTRRPPSSG